MANGDLAATAGMDTVAGSDDIRQSYDEINKSRDYLARHQLDGTHPASAITSGVLPVARGGTGRAAPFSATSPTGPNKATRRLLVVDEENVIYAATGDVDPGYLGFRAHGGVDSASFNEFGNAVIEHGLPWTPVVVIVSARLGADAITVDRGLSAPTSTGFGVRAWLPNGDPYQDVISNIEWIAWGLA